MDDDLADILIDFVIMMFQASPTAGFVSLAVVAIGVGIVWMIKES